MPSKPGGLFHEGNESSRIRRTPAVFKINTCFLPLWAASPGWRAKDLQEIVAVIMIAQGHCNRHRFGNRGQNLL